MTESVEGRATKVSKTGLTSVIVASLILLASLMIFVFYHSLADWWGDENASFFAMTVWVVGSLGAIFSFILAIAGRLWEGVTRAKMGWSLTIEGMALSFLAFFVAFCIQGWVPSSIESNEYSTISNLRSLSTAQFQFKRARWYALPNTESFANGAKDLHVLNCDVSKNPNLIDRAFSTAFGEDAAQMVSTNPIGKRHKAGYVYVDLSTKADGTPVDLAEPKEPVQSFLYCAIPADYGHTGRRTFIVNTAGDVYGMDMKGQPVTKWPSEEELSKWQKVSD